MKQNKINNNKTGRSKLIPANKVSFHESRWNVAADGQIHVMLATDRPVWIDEKLYSMRPVWLPAMDQTHIIPSKGPESIEFSNISNTWCQDAEAIVRADRVIRLSLGVIVADAVVLPPPSAEKRLADTLIFNFHHQVTIRSVFCPNRIAFNWIELKIEKWRWWTTHWCECGRWWRPEAAWDLPAEGRTWCGWEKPQDRRSAATEKWFRWLYRPARPASRDPGRPYRREWGAECRRAVRPCGRDAPWASQRTWPASRLEWWPESRGIPASLWPHSGRLREQRRWVNRRPWSTPGQVDVAPPGRTSAGVCRRRSSRLGLSLLLQLLSPPFSPASVPPRTIRKGEVGLGWGAWLETPDGNVMNAGHTQNRIRE